MTIPDDKQRKSPVDRFHTIISGVPSEKSSVEQTQKNEVIDRLPKKPKPADATSAPPSVPPSADRPAAPASNPKKSKPVVSSSTRPSAPPSSDQPAAPVSKRETYFRALWTIASILSLVVNVILIIVLLVTVQMIGAMRSSSYNNITGLLSGLYGNFELMDNAHIKTTIPVKTDVPVKLDVCIKTGTDVTLNRDVTIPSAKVTLQTGGLNISNAPTSILLPNNTILPVNLDLCVPVESTIPVALDVNVDIPLAQTELHKAIQGLKDTVKPYYCLVSPKAVSAVDGSSVCNK